MKQFKNLKPQPLEIMPQKTTTEMILAKGELKPLQVPDIDLDAGVRLNFGNYMRLLYDWGMRELGIKAGYIEEKKYGFWELVLKALTSLLDFLGSRNANK